MGLLLFFLFLALGFYSLFFISYTSFPSHPSQNTWPFSPSQNTWPCFPSSHSPIPITCDPSPLLRIRDLLLLPFLPFPEHASFLPFLPFPKHVTLLPFPPFLEHVTYVTSPFKNIILASFNVLARTCDLRVFCIPTQICNLNFLWYASLNMRPGYLWHASLNMWSKALGLIPQTCSLGFCGMSLRTCDLRFIASSKTNFLPNPSHGEARMYIHHLINSHYLWFIIVHHWSRS